MSLSIRSALLLLAFGCVQPVVVRGQTVGSLFNPCCNTCGQQQCTCSSTRAVVETRYRQQNCLNYTTVKKTGCRTEPFCETVPVTKVDCVTVDEGCYQMVWVPKPVTKAVPRTEYQQRTSYRQVPFEYCEQVPVVTSRIVPEQWVRYVTEHRYTTSTPATPVCPPEPCPPPSHVGGVGVAPGYGGGLAYGGPAYGGPGYGRPYGPGFGAGVGPAGFGMGVGGFGAGAGVGPNGLGLGVGPVGAGVGPGGIGVGVGGVGVGVGPFVAPINPVGIGGSAAPIAVPYSASTTPARPRSGTQAVAAQPTQLPTAGIVSASRRTHGGGGDMTPVPPRNPNRVMQAGATATTPNFGYVRQASGAYPAQGPSGR